LKPIDLIVVALAIALVCFTIVYNVRKKKRGESTCGYCNACRTKKNGGDACGR